MIPSVILNIVIFAVNIVCTIVGLKKLEPKILFRYFTVLSNLFCAAAAAITAIAGAFGTLPLWVVLLKYTGTAAVTVTLLTVLLFLAPSSGEWKKLLSGPDLIWHLICPLLAIVSFCAFEHKTRFGFGWTLLGVLPVLLYGIFYFSRVVLAREENRMEDFYGFNKGGKWYLSVPLMLLGAFAISVVLWAV